MSARSFEQSREARKLCQWCRDRKARFRFRGVVKADRDHTLCFECFRAARDRRRAEVLRSRPAQAPGDAAPFQRPRTVTARAVEHRQRMLAHLTVTQLQSAACPSVPPDFWRPGA